MVYIEAILYGVHRGYNYCMVYIEAILYIVWCTLRLYCMVYIEALLYGVH